MRPRLPLLAAALILAMARLGAQTFPMEAGDLRRSNHVAGVPAWSFPLQLQWYVDPCLNTPSANPVVLPDKVVISDQARVLALSRADGQQLWSWFTPQFGVFWNSPTWDADRNRLYVSSWEGALIALDAATGTPLWNINDGRSPKGGCMAAPTYLNDRIIYKDGKKDYVCIDADTRAVLWRWSFIREQMGVTPALDGGMLYVAGSLGEMACVNASTGATVWRRNNGQKRAYGGAVLLTDDKIYAQTQPGLVECRLRSTGAIVWEHQNTSYGLGNLACDGTNLYCTNDDRVTRALDCDDGTVRWTRSHDGNFARSGALVCGGTMFSSGCTGEYYGDNAATGVTEWIVAHGAGNSFNDWAYADGDLFVSNREGRVFCFRNPCVGCSPTVTPTVSPTPTESATLTASATPTPTDSSSATLTATPSATPTLSASPSPTASPTLTLTPTPSATLSFTLTPTPSPTLTLTPTPTITPTPSPTLTLTLTETLTPSATPSASPVIAGSTATPTAAGPVAQVTPGHCITYPNPVRGDHMTCAFDMPKPGRAKVVVLDARGRPCLQASEHLPAGPAKMELNVGGLRRGIYFQRVSCEFDDGGKDKMNPGKFTVLR